MDRFSIARGVTPPIEPLAKPLPQIAQGPRLLTNSVKKSLGINLYPGSDLYAMTMKSDKDVNIGDLVTVDSSGNCIKYDSSVHNGPIIGVVDTVSGIADNNILVKVTTRLREIG